VPPGATMTQRVLALIVLVLKYYPLVAPLGFVLWLDLWWDRHCWRKTSDANKIPSTQQSEKTPVVRHNAQKVNHQLF
jgi:predicted membrane-bound dolichyl-phosphate-mannose-protein mannosyltransferase